MGAGLRRAREELVWWWDSLSHVWDKLSRGKTVSAFQKTVSICGKKLTVSSQEQLSRGGEQLSRDWDELSRDWDELSCERLSAWDVCESNVKRRARPSVRRNTRKPPIYGHSRIGCERWKHFFEKHFFRQRCKQNMNIIIFRYCATVKNFLPLHSENWQAR
jgi:hypothetical protein